MAEKIVSTQITDHVDGQPAIVLSNGNWGVFDPKTNMYKDNGIKASPEDDATAIKYYKLRNTSTPPEAPTRAGGWDSLTTLNASLAQAGWDEDPLTTSKTNKFCWIAFYGKENVVDVSATESAGHLIFKPKYTRTKVSLWSNYADSPTIAVVGNEIHITNPDGSVVTQKFATTEAIADIANLIVSLQEQMDGSVYSYSLEGEPSMTKVPVTTWIDGVDPSLIADIYSQHVGDTYTDLLTYVSYRFALIQGSSSDPSNYGWKVIEDSALTNALGEIARLGREKVTIFTETPTAYRKGDMWLQPDNTMKIAIASRETFSEGDWIQPYATKTEVSDIREDLTAAQADATAAKNQIGELVLGLTTMDGAVADAIKDSIISDTEHMNLTTELKQLNVDQESLNATVAYLLASTYLPTTPKNALVAKKELLLGANGTSGSMGAYRTAISTMIADRVITAPERTAYNNAFSTYKTHLKDFNTAISNARQAIDAELKRLADEKVDNIKIGGRNLIKRSDILEWNDYSNIQFSEGEDDFGHFYLYRFSILTGQGNIFPNIEFKENTQYAFSAEGMLETGSAPRFIVEYTDGSISGNLFYAGVDEPLRVDYITEEGKTVDYIKHFHGSAGEVRLYNIQLIEGNKIRTDWTLAPEDVQAEIDALEDFSNEAFADGVVDRAEAKAIEKYINTVNESFESVKSTYDKMLLNSLLITTEKAKLTGKYTPLSTAKGNLITSITTAIADGVATKAEKADVDTKFGLYNIAMKAYQTALEEARIAMDVELKRLSDAKVDEAVIKATYWSIKASTPVIYKDANSATASGVHTPVIVNGELRSGTTTTQGGFISIQPNDGAESTATASPRTIAPTDAEGKTSYTVRLYDEADKVTLLDTMTIPVVFKGSSGVNVAMSNEADVLPASPTGEVSDYADTGNVIRVFEGANELAYTKPTTAIVKGVSVDISAKNVTNEVENGDFSSGTDGWSLWGNAEIQTGGVWVIENNRVVFADRSNTANGRFEQDILCDIGDKFYIAIDKEGMGSLSLMVFDYNTGSNRLTIEGNLSGTVTTINRKNYRLSIAYSTGTDFNNFSFSEVRAINLTQTFGAGNEPTVEECDKIFGGYFEGTTPLSDVALGGNGTYQVSPSSTGITEGTKSASGLACSFANASNMTTDSAKITFYIYGLSSSGIPFEFSRAQNFSKSKIGADGADGEGGINVMITRQGSFRTYWRQIGDQGQILTTPEKVSEIIGGVEIGGIKYVQCKVLIYKGSVDVTASALADPTTQGRWYLNNGFISGTDTLNIPIIHADGVDDEVRFEYTDTNAKNWKGA